MVKSKEGKISLPCLIVLLGQGQRGNHFLNVGNLIGQSFRRDYPLGGNKPEWLVPKTNSLSSTEGRLFRGREGVSLLVHACHSTLSIPFLFLFSPFCYFDSFPTLLSFLMLACVMLWWWWCCDSLLGVAIVVVMILYTTSALYILPAVIDFYNFSL